VVKPAAKKEVVTYLVQDHQMSIRQACITINIARSSYYYEKMIDPEEEVIMDKLEVLAQNHPTYGFWKMFHRLRNEGSTWNHKKVYRIYKSMNMHLKRKYKRRLPRRSAVTLEEPSSANQVWSMDFMSDSLQHGRRFRTLNIIDDYNRELCWLEVAISIDAQAVTKILDYVIKERGKPETIRVDNGPEFTSHQFMEYCESKGIEIRYIQPGKPTQNAFIERFNRSYRNEVLDIYLFKKLTEVREISYKWAEDYNHQRPHQSLGNRSPIEFAKQQLTVN